MAWEGVLQQRLAGDRAYAAERNCDNTKAEARIAYISPLFDTYKDLLDSAEAYSWNEGYVNVRVWVLAEMLEILAADDEFWSA